MNTCDIGHSIRLAHRPVRAGRAAFIFHLGRPCLCVVLGKALGLVVPVHAAQRTDGVRHTP